MSVPKSSEARLYYRAAKQRHEDAQLLLAAERTTGAVYLAGYTVECFLKALVLASVAPGARRGLLAEFHGSRAHSLEWLCVTYRRHVGIAMPMAVNRHVSRLTAWSTDLRYSTGFIKQREAKDFMDSVLVVAGWADGRM